MPVTFTVSILFTIITVAISIGGLLLFRKVLSPDSLRTHHDVTDPYSQFVGMLFAVLLGFMVADAMQRFGAARQIVEQEASSVGNVFRLADAFPDATKLKIQNLCRKYCFEVAHVEWPLLAQKTTSVVTWHTYKDLWKSCTEYDPVTPRQCDAHQALLPCMAALGDSRRLRVNALHNGLPPVLWSILVIGGLATTIFTYFFNVDNLKLQIVMVGIVSLVICLNIYLLATYDDPFSGDVMIQPSSFETQVELFNMELKDPPPPAPEAIPIK